MFLALILSRAWWIFVGGPNRFEAPDSIEYLELAGRIGAGNFDMGLFRFIRPPGLPAMIAATKLAWPAYWETALLCLNLLFTVGTGALLYFFCFEFFGRKRAARWALLFYVIHIPLLVYAAGIASEPASVFFSMAALLFFQKMIQDRAWKWVLLFAVSLYVAVLFRTMILAGVPVLLVTVAWIAVRKGRQYLFRGLVATGIFLLLATPFGLYNQKKHGSFVISSNGGSFIFLNANSEVGYKDAVLYEKLSAEEQYYVKNFSEYGDRFFGPQYNQILLLPQTEKQRRFQELAWQWIRENPGKFAEAKVSNLVRLLIPGRSFRHVPFNEWLISFLIGLPLYIFCYAGIALELSALRSNSAQRVWLLGFFAAMSAALVLYLYTYRYKVYGLEFIYIIFAAHAADWLHSGRKSAET
jgi:4-amino-4-deoxy-L-arabinose transferase-like glycosyltransferase